MHERTRRGGGRCARQERGGWARSQIVAASTRLAAPSLRRIRFTWDFAVAIDRRRRAFPWQGTDAEGADLPDRVPAGMLALPQDDVALAPAG